MFAVETFYILKPITYVFQYNLDKRDKGTDKPRMLNIVFI